MLTGNDSPLPFAVLFSLRSHLARNRAVSALTVAAIATSVALASGLEMSTRSVRAELERTADALAGAARLEVTGGGMGISEDLLPTVAGVNGVLAASPLLEATFWIREGELEGQALRVLGVDFLSDLKVRGYTIVRDRLEVRDPLRLIAQPGAVIVSQGLAKRLGVGEGGEIPVVSGGAELELFVRGLLRPGGIADAFGGQVAVMDIYSLQELLGRRGWFDRIDVVPAENIAVEQLRGALSAAVAGRATVRRPASRSEYADQVFGTVNLGVWVLAVIGIIVAAFLSYGTMSLSVDGRLEEFALLQSAGLEGHRIRWLVRTDAVLLASLGTGLGLLAGLGLSQSFFAVFSSLSDQMQNVQIERLEIGPSTLAVAVGVGLVVSVMGSHEPARRATALPPLEVLLAARRRPDRARIGRRRAALLVLLVGVLAASLALPLFLPPLLRVAMLFGSTLLLIVGSAELGLSPLIRGAQWICELTLPRVGAFVGSSLVARPRHTGLSVAAVTGIAAGLSGILIVVLSVEQSVGDWLSLRYRGGVMISAEDPFASIFHEPLRHETIALVRSTPGTGPVLESFGFPVLFQGEEVILVARSMDVMAEHGSLAVLDADWPEVARALERGEIAISEAFSRRFGYRVGQLLALDAPRGAQTFRIAALVRDYAGRAGMAHLDIRTFDRFWTRPGAASVVIWPPGSLESVVDEIRRRAGADQALFFTRTEIYAQWATRVFDRFVGLLYLVVGLTAALGGLAVLSLMLGVVSVRRRELGLLRTAGATRAQVSALVLIDSLLVGGIGALLGLGLGVLSSIPMCAILTDSMGWTVERSVDAGLLAGVAAGVMAASALAGLYPAWRAQRVGPTAMFQPD